MNMINLFHDEQLAQASLEPTIWDYFPNGGSGDEVTLRENCSAFERIKLLPRVLRRRAFCQYGNDGTGKNNPFSRYHSSNCLPLYGSF